MSTKQFLFSGFGGQGILFAGKFLAYKGLLDGKQVSWLPSYGPEMRGGTASCSVILSDDAVGSPIVSAPDVLVAMNLPSLDKYESTVVPGGLILADSTLIERKVERDDVKVVYIPATRMAGENGISSLANMIIVGKMLTTDAVLIGAGKLGQALMAYKGFDEYGLNILAGFDARPAMDATEDGKPIYPMEKMESFCRTNKVLMGIITVPAEHAQKVCDQLIASGIKAIWTFANVHLTNLKMVTVFVRSYFKNFGSNDINKVIALLFNAFYLKACHNHFIAHFKYGDINIHICFKLI